jgi:lipopolysaccharide export system protein LptC
MRRDLARPREASLMLFRVFTLLAVLALAVSTWLLSTPGRAPGAASPAKQALRPAYYLKDAVLTEYDADGAPSIRISAERIDQIARSNEVDLHNIRVDYQAPSGTAWVMVGDFAHVRPGGKVVDMWGNIRLEGVNLDRTGAPVIRTQTMTYDVTASIASTESDVQIEFLRHTLTARGLVANLRERTVRLESRVNGRFRP